MITMIRNGVEKVKGRIASLEFAAASLRPPEYAPIRLNSSDPAVEEEEISLEVDKEYELSALSYWRSRLWTFLLGLPRAIFLFLLPSFITNCWKETKPRKLHPTSFLDGVRGIAAVIVSVGHLILHHEVWTTAAYDASSKSSNFLQLPFIRLIFAIRAMVPIFFVISGYVLSARQVKMIRTGEHQKMIDLLMSVTFRRGIRLFLPSIVGLMLLEWSIYVGWQSWKPLPSIWLHVKDLFQENITHLMYVWQWEVINTRLMQLWTIPVEFSCSMLLFMFIFATSRLKAWIRMSFLFCLMIHCQATGHWGIFEFLAGFVIAHYEDAWSAEEPRSTKTVFGKFTRILHDVFWVCALILALFVCGWPEIVPEKTPGFDILVKWTPSIYIIRGPLQTSLFWFSLAAPIVIWSMFRLPILQRPFVSRIALYAGDISYSIYIIHYWIFLSLGPPLVIYVRSWMGVGTEDSFSQIVTVSMEAFLMLFVCIWHADIFMRLIDQPVVRLSRVVEHWCQEK